MKLLNSSPITFFQLMAFVLLLGTAATTTAQVALNEDDSSPDASAFLDIKSITKGLLTPRMTQAQRNAIGSPATGLLIYQTDNTPGFYFYSGSAWTLLHSGNTTLLEDDDGNTKIQVEESNNENIIRMDLDGSERLVIKTNAGGETMLELPNNDGNTFLGLNSGTASTSGQFNTFVGGASGFKTTTGGENTFLGEGAGVENVSGNQNTFLGRFAGLNATGSSNVLLGYSAGKNEAGSNKLYIDNSDTASPLLWGDFNSNLLRVNGRLEATQGFADADGNTKIQVEESNNENIIRMDLDGSERLVIKKNANGNTMLETPNNDNNVFIGENAGAANNATGSSPEGESNVFMGWQAGAANTTGAFNMFLGGAAGFKTTTGGSNIFIGDGAGFNNLTGGNNTYVGRRAGFNSTGSGNIFLGLDAGTNETGDNKLYIDNSNTTTPLLLGDFSTDLLRINGTLRINDAFSFPTADGASGQVLQTNGAGALTWQTPSSGAPDEITDADGNTKIQVEESANENIIRMDLDGSERLVIKKNVDGWTMLDLPNNNFNVYLGENAGLGTGFGGKENTFMGYNAGKNINFGDTNTCIGTAACDDISGGSYNTVLGAYAGNSVVDGHGNVMIGYHAGTNETGSNKLYIQSWNANTIPLIWGDFSASRVGIDRVATTNTFEVSGNASKAAAGDWLANSDARLKQHILPLDSKATLQKILQLQGVTYEWKDDKTGYERPKGQQYGFTAQNVQAVFPQLVQEDAEGWLQTSYGTYDAMYVEAFRALVQRMDALEQENNELKAQLDEVQELKAAVSELRGLLLQAGASADE